MMKYFLAFGLFLILTTGYSQSGSAKRALENMVSGDFEKARDLLDKAYQKDPSDPIISFAWSKYYEPYNLDSSYSFIKKSQGLFQKIEQKEKSKFAKAGIDSLGLIKQRFRIDSLAYAIAENTDTEESYSLFIEKHEAAREVPQAEQMRYKAGFRVAQQINSIESFQEFSDKYPLAPQKDEAIYQYEKLYYTQYTASKKAGDLIEYLKSKTESPFRKSAEIQLVDILASGNDKANFDQLLSILTTDQARKKLLDIYFHWMKSSQNEELQTQAWLTDSLKMELEGQKSSMLPILDHFGFNYVNESGNVLFKNYFKTIDPRSLCNFSPKDLLMYMYEDKSILISNTDHIILEDQFTGYNDLGYGILTYQKKDKKGVLHKSGYSISPAILDDVQIIGGSFIAIKTGSGWGMTTFTGKEIIAPQYDSLFNVGNNYLILHKDKYAVLSYQDLMKAADLVPVNPIFIYDDFESWPEQHIWVKTGEKEALINRNSGYDIKPGEQVINLMKRGFNLKKEEGNFYLNDRLEVIISNYRTIEINDSFIAVKKEEGYFLVSGESEDVVAYDSIKLWGSTFAYIKRGAREVIKSENNSDYVLKPGYTLFLLKSNKGIEFVQVNYKNQTDIIDRSGATIFTGELAKISALGESYLSVDQKGKKYLYSTTGQRLLKSSFDGLIGTSEGGVSLIKDNLIGYYHLQDSLYASPDYEKRIVPGLKKELIVNGKEGFHIYDSKSETHYEDYFDELQNWNSTNYLAKKGQNYYLYNTTRGLQNTVNFSSIEPFSGSTLYKITNNDQVGLIDVNKGVLILPEYTFIEERDHFFIGVKYLSSAKFYVVSYFNSSGNLIWTGGLEKEQYDLLMCDE